MKLCMPIFGSDVSTLYPASHVSVTIRIHQGFGHESSIPGLRAAFRDVADDRTCIAGLMTCGGKGRCFLHAIMLYIYSNHDMFELHDWVNMQNRRILQEALNCIACRVRAAWVAMPASDLGALQRWSRGIRAEMVSGCQIHV